MKTINVRPGGWDTAFKRARAGDVFYLFVHGLRYSPELRQNPPRVRLLVDGLEGGAHIECELLDPWPDAPTYWPTDSAPGAATALDPTPSAAPATPAKRKPKAPAPPITPATANQGRKA